MNKLKKKNSGKRKEKSLEILKHTQNIEVQPKTEGFYT